MRHAAISSKVGLALTSAAIIALALAVAGMFAGGVRAGDPPSQTITLASGVSSVMFQIQGVGGTSGTAQVYSQNQGVNGGTGSECHSLWDAPIAGSQWIGVSTSCTGNGAIGTTGSAKVTDYSVGFVLPAGFEDPSISVTLHADNVATVSLNDIEIDAQVCCLLTNFQNPPDVFSSSNAELFESGPNTLRFTVEDYGTVTGLDFRAVVSFTQGAAELSHFEIAEIGDPQTAGGPFDVVVTAIDINGNVKSDYEGGAAFLDTLPDAPDGTQPVYGALNFVNGVATASVTAFDATEGEETVSLTVEDQVPPETFRVLLGEGDPSGTSNGFSVLPGEPDNIVFGQQPTRTEKTEVIDPAPTVIVRDAYNNVATQATNPVTMAIGANPGAGVLVGTLSETPVDGVATFDNLAVSQSGTGYTLVASTSVGEGTASATSDPFDIPNVIIPCGAGCSASASNATTTVNVTVPGGGGGTARVLAGGAVDNELAIALNAPNGSFTCAGPPANAIGSISLVDPPAGFTKANPIKVTITYPRGVVRVPLHRLVVCKDKGPGTPFFVLPKCTPSWAFWIKKKIGAPCEQSRSYAFSRPAHDVPRAGTFFWPAVKVVLLITSTDPRLASK